MIVTIKKAGVLSQQTSRTIMFNFLKIYSYE